MKRAIIIATSLLSAVFMAESATPPPGTFLAELRDQSAKRKNAARLALEIKEWKVSPEAFRQFLPPEEKPEPKKPSPPQTAGAPKAEPRTITCGDGVILSPRRPFAMYSPATNTLVVNWSKKEVEKFDAWLKKYRAGVKRPYNRR